MKTGGKDKWRKWYLQSISKPGNAMMDEHLWRAFCRLFLPRVGGFLYCRASFAENWTRFFVFLPFVPLHRRWIGGSKETNGMWNRARRGDHRAFYRFRKLLSSKWKPCHVFENKGWKDIYIYIFQDCWRWSVKDFILACGVQLHTPENYSILNCSIFLRFGKWRR